MFEFGDLFGSILSIFQDVFNTIFAPLIDLLGGVLPL